MADAPEDALGFPPGAFARLDETDDALFYEPARLVQHIDDGAIAALTELYRTVLPAGGALLDLMSSWISHLPPEIQYREIVEPALQRFADLGIPDLAHCGRRSKRAGMPRRLDGVTGHPELIHGPFDGISDMHIASSRTLRPRGAAGRLCGRA